ncbi:MAG: hypothetical protein V4624_11535, partial [Pseudomonadota bacterium]
LRYTSASLRCGAHYRDAKTSVNTYLRKSLWLSVFSTKPTIQPVYHPIFRRKKGSDFVRPHETVLL